MRSVVAIRALVEAEIPSAFAPCLRPELESIPTGIAKIDCVTGGIPLGGLTELCGSNLASSGKSSVLTSLLAAASQKHFCALIDAGDLERRRASFWLMIVYVGCGLGLLLTTCFLGLRRYLRQRRLRMPAAMTGAWLTAGGLLIVALLVIGAVLPRPDAEYSLFNLSPAKSPKRGASKYAMKGDRPGEGEGRPGADDPEGKKNDADSGGKEGKEKGERGDATKQGKDGSGGKGDKSSQSGDKQGKNSGENQNPNQNNPNNLFGNPFSTPGTQQR